MGGKKMEKMVMTSYGVYTPLRYEMIKPQLPSKTKEYLTQVFDKQAKMWIEQFDKQVELLLDKWHLTIVGQEENSKFGAVFYTFSLEHGKTVLKMIPPFSKRMKQEIYCYQSLPYAEMCPMLEYDSDIGAILLQYFPGNKEQDLDDYLSLFQCMKKERRFVTENEEVTDYWSVWEESAACAIKGKQNLSAEYENLLTNCLEQSNKLMPYAKELPKYYVHGDAHVHNIVGNKELVLIDPIGYNAPFGIEYARFVGTWYRENLIETDELKEVLRSLSDNMQDYLHNCLMLALDVTFRMCNTFSEGNTQAEICDAIHWAWNVWQAIGMITPVTV